MKGSDSIKKKIYLAGAMSCYYADNKVEKAVIWRKKAEKFFKDNTDDFICINPMNYFVIDGNLHQSEFEPMKFDLRKVKESAVVLVNLEDLYRSLGTSDEIIYAWINDIPIVGFIENEHLINTVHPWKKCQIDRIEVGKNAQDRAMEHIREYYS